MEYLPGGKLEAALRQRLQSLGVDLTWDHSKGRKSAMAQKFGNRGAQPTDANGPASWLQQLALSALRILGMDRVMWLTRKLVNIRLRAAALLGCDANGSSFEVSDALRVVLEAHGFQLFFCPLFNSDPHPGNILLLPDGRIGLLDFGQCRRMSHRPRADIARLFGVLGRAKQGKASESELASAFAATGMSSVNADDRFLSIMPRLLFDKVDVEWLYKEIPLGKEWRDVMKCDKLDHFHPQMSSLCRMVMLLRGQCMVLQENVSLVDIWQPFAERWLREHGESILTC
jgi:aarF domain-containing kinase